MSSREEPPPTDESLIANELHMCLKGLSASCGRKVPIKADEFEMATVQPGEKKVKEKKVVCASLCWELV